MEKQVTCKCGSDHQGHICMLKSKGDFEEIARISIDPKFFCFTCGSEAHCADNLCVPTKID